MEKFAALFESHAWLEKILALVVLGFLLHIIELAFYKYFANYYKNRNKSISLAFVNALHSPLVLFIWFIVITVAMQIIIIQFNLNGAVTEYFSKSRQVVGIIFVLWFVLRLIRGMETSIIREKRFGRRAVSDTTTINALAQIIRVLSFVIFLMMLLQALGQPIGTLLAVGGIGGLAISFAAKDTLANLIGGLMLYWDRPFSVGDNVRCLDKGIDGVVEKIGWRLTHLRSYDKRAIYVPNAVFSSSAIENISRMTHRRIKTTIGLRYEDMGKIAAIANDIKSMLSKQEGIDHTLNITVAFDTFAASSINLTVQAFTQSTDWDMFQAVQQTVFLKIAAIVETNEADFAFPTTTVSIPEGIEFIQLEEGNHDEGKLQ